jgi:hypothetical protein
MRSIVRSLPLALLVLLGPGLVLAQGLGDAAARERQKREASGHEEKARVLTNDDLPKSNEGSASTAAAAPEASAESSPQRDSDHRATGDEKAGTELEKAQARVEEARAAVVAAEERVKALGDKLNPMSPSFIYGGASQGDLVAEEAQTREELRQAEAELADARDALVKATQAAEDVRLRRAPAPE